MGIFYGRHTGSRSYTYSAELAAKLTKRGARSSTSAAGLLTYMGGEMRVDSWEMCPEEAEQAARCIEQAAKKLHPADRRIAEQIAADAWEAANTGRSWTVS
ncbi:hypothetical protein ACLQ2R_17140 [Streptosporangium sp. DT93]|uniref:DUF7739 domain-containing protein n=1 Tax=Streptosporangium sp. DT93 TaxID=3393428 RepID=UPI003CE8645E